MSWLPAQVALPVVFRQAGVCAEITFGSLILSWDGKAISCRMELQPGWLGYQPGWLGCHSGAQAGLEPHRGLFLERWGR